MHGAGRCASVPAPQRSGKRLLLDFAPVPQACAGRDTAKTKEGVLLLAPGSVSQLIISYRALLVSPWGRGQALAVRGTVKGLK